MNPLLRYYAQRAQEYEQIYQKPERQADLRELRSHVERTFAGLHVLEIACGTGNWTEVLARSAASVTAMDFNEEVLAIARSKHLNPQKVTFQQADAYDLPRFSKKHNAAFAGFWWSHIPLKGLMSFLTNLHRALAPGAKTMFIDNCYVEGSSTPISRTDLDGNTYLLRKLDDGSTHEVLKNFPTEPELRGAFNGIATEVNVTFLRYYWILTYVPTLTTYPV